MKIERFNKVSGSGCTLLSGTDRYGYSVNIYYDFYEMDEIYKDGRIFSNELRIYDLKNNTVRVPFERKDNIGYTKPHYSDGLIYFLQGDFNDRKIKLFKMKFDSEVELVYEIKVDDVNLYNISIVGDEIHIVSSDEILECYYPEKFKLKLKENESVILIEGDLIYLSEWYEEGVDDFEITNEYKYYEKVIVKNKKGEKVSEEIGSLELFPDGIWRIS